MRYTFLPNEALEKEVGDRILETKVLSSFSNTTSVAYADIKRSRVVYPSRDIAESDIKDHIMASRQVLKETEVFIFTLGFTEVWQSKERGITVPIYPSGLTNGYDLPSDFKFVATNYQENYENLRKGIEILQRNNPEVQIVLSVSPIHLNKTFREDIDVVSSSCASKSILRCAADQICKEIPNVHYFPSYEIVNILCAQDGIRPYPDGHHVDRRVVERIMGVFSNHFKK